MVALPPAVNTIVRLVGFINDFLVTVPVQNFCDVEGLDRVAGEARKAYGVEVTQGHEFSASDLPHENVVNEAFVLLVSHVNPATLFEVEACTVHFDGP